jgi:RNA polymerase sigma-70 factor (ECF subfamily)
MIFLFLSSLTDDCAPDSPPTHPPREIADPANDFPELDDLLRRAKDGDGDAFSDLVAHYERFVYNTAVRVLSASGQSSDLADDIAQDSFIKAWRNLTQFRGECTFSTWLFRVTVNTAKDAIRSAARRPTVSLSYPDGDDEDGYAEWDVPVTSGDEIPEEVLEKKELILGVRRAVEALPEEQRQVVVMRDLHGLSYQEISDTLGVELGTDKSRLNRGRTNLKILLENGNFL